MSESKSAPLVVKLLSGAPFSRGQMTQRSVGKGASLVLSVALAFGLGGGALAQAPLMSQGQQVPLQYRPQVQSAPQDQPQGGGQGQGTPPGDLLNVPAAAGGQTIQSPFGSLPSVEPQGQEELKLDSRALPLGGALKNPEVWEAFRARFVTDQGRIVDTANGMISHSEGQGYAMVAAVAAGDRAGFERIWGWTRANLMVRDDKLLAWRWDPDKRPGVGDINNATDGDILIAWALAEAGDFWNDVSYRVEARRIAVEVGRKTVLFKTRWGSLLLPSIFGFAAENRPDGPVINISYWVFPAFQRLHIVAPEIDWAGVTRSGLEVLVKSRFGPANLPTEWISAKGNELKPADGFKQTFGYNSIRIPLYMAWAGLGERNDYAPFVALWNGNSSVAAIDSTTGRRTQSMTESGYSAISALTLCAVNGTKVNRDFVRSRANENYYPAMLHLLSLVAMQMRYPACLGG